MARFEILGAELELPRNLALLDTNVLVAYANNEDALHDQAELFIESQDSFELIVVPPVVVEACGLLAKRRLQQRVLYLMKWISTPGNVVLLPSPHPPLDVSTTLVGHEEWMSKYKVDYVDTYLMEVANRLTRSCDLRPHAPIVTFDTGDFMKCSVQGHSFSIFDMRDFQLVDFSL